MDISRNTFNRYSKLADDDSIYTLIIRNRRTSNLSNRKEYGGKRVK